MIPPQPGAVDHGKRKGPHGWSGPLAGIFLILGVIFAYLLYRVISWARISAGSAAEVPVSAGEIILLGGGSLACFAITIILLRWRRRN